MPRHFFCCYESGKGRKNLMTERQTPILIRFGKLEDVDELVGLLQELFSLEEDFEFSRERQKKGLELMLAKSPDRLVWVAESGGKVVGMCTAQVLVSTAEGGEAALVEDVVVHEDFRGKGIGKKLMTTLEKWADKRGIRRLQLLADQKNTPALQFYSCLGWSRTQLKCWRRQI
jgi:GNAT superfamily N-acetyltransferase